MEDLPRNSPMMTPTVTAFFLLMETKRNENECKERKYVEKKKIPETYLPYGPIRDMAMNDGDFAFSVSYWAY